MTLEEQRISFETARLAKERGFDWEVLVWYSENGESIDMLSEFDGFMLPTWTNSYKDSGYAGATQALLQKWLRDVHKIHVHMYSIHLQDGSGYKWSVDVYNLKKLTEEEYIVMTGHALTDGIKDTYEEALEMGLNAALRIDMLWE